MLSTLVSAAVSCARVLLGMLAARRLLLMARLMLFMAKHRHLRHRTMQVFQSKPRSFAAMLALHVGEGSTRDHISSGIALGWELLKA